MQEKDVEAIKDVIEGYENSYWTCSVSKLGYAGTAIISQVCFILLFTGALFPALGNVIKFSYICHCLMSTLAGVLSGFHKKGLIFAMGERLIIYGFIMYTFCFNPLL